VTPTPEEYAEAAFGRAVYALCREEGYPRIAERGGVSPTVLVCWSRGAMIPPALVRFSFLRAVCS